MARQNINRGTTANDGTGDTLRASAGKINDNFIELYQLLGGDSAQVTTKMSLSDNGLIYKGLTYDTTLGFIEGSAAVSLNLPDESGTLALVGGTQTLVNKTLTVPVLTSPQINDTSADHQYLVGVSELAADRTITLPLLATNDEFTFNAHTQTLTNKTLTSPSIVTPNITTAINDVNSAEIIRLTPTSSAVNEIQISNAATTGVPQVAAVGTDTNVSLGLSGTGTGLVEIQTGVTYKSETVNANAQAISLARTMSIFNLGTTSTSTLADGTEVGQTKTFVNRAAGAVTVTPTTFFNGTSFTVKQKGIVNCVWVDNTDGWMLMMPKLYTSSDTDALYYITA